MPAVSFFLLLGVGRGDPAFLALRRSALIGCPLGTLAFVEAIARQFSRNIMPAKRCPKPRERQDKR